MLENRNVLSLSLGLLGALKLALDAAGLHIITDGEVNAIANGIAAVFTIAGVVMSHIKKPAETKSQEPAQPTQPTQQS